MTTTCEEHIPSRDDLVIWEYAQDKESHPFRIIEVFPPNKQSGCIQLLMVPTKFTVIDMKGLNFDVVPDSGNGDATPIFLDNFRWRELSYAVGGDNA